MNDRTPVDLWSLRLFVEVAGARSMTKAAARLGLTQSAVSQTIRRLEASLGVELIERGRRPLALTASGIVLERRAEPLLRDAAQLPQALRDASQMPAEEIRLGFVDTFASTAGPELIRNLTKTATRVVVWSGLTPSLTSALLGREVDAIVTSDPMHDHDGLDRRTLWHEPFMILAPRMARLRVAAQSLHELSSELPMVRFSARSHIGLQIERHLRRIGVAAERRIEVDGSDALVAMVAAGVGWAIATPLCLLQGAAHADGVTVAEMKAPRFSRSLSLVWRKDGPAAVAIRAARLAARALEETCLPKLQSLAPSFAGRIMVTRGVNDDERRSGRA